MRSLRARVAVAAVAATAAALVLMGTVVVASFVLDGRRGAWWADLEARQRVVDPGQFAPGQVAPGPFGPDRFAPDGGPPRAARLVGRRLLVVGLGTLGLVGAAGLALGGLALRPLQALRDTAERVASTGDLSTRVPEGAGPEEVDALAGSLNAMLARLERSTAATGAALEASRRFAADAGHELRTPLTSMQANLDVLLAAPDLPEAERGRVLADVVGEQRRVVALLDALQTLARGDSAAAARREPVDLGDIIDAAVQAARARHPRASVGFHDPGEVGMSGWPEGLRVLVDNLIENALRHGRPDGRVDVSVSREGSSVVLLVDDDGPGIPPDERERVFARFVRGRGARASGSGLGLALVAQQAALHGGEASIEDAPGGGARVRVRLAAGHAGGDLPAQAAR